MIDLASSGYARLGKWLSGMTRGADGIYGAPISSKDQAIEIEMRERVAASRHPVPMRHIARHHSVPVMDHEVQRFLKGIVKGGLILDIGGCWGWHWRTLYRTRPDVHVVIVDFVRANLGHAQEVLGGAVGTSVTLVHGDATALDLPDELFDGIWTVQTLRHILNFKSAVLEAHRVLKVGGLFSNYSLNIQPPIQRLYRLLGRSYVVSGWVSGSFWLERANAVQKECIEAIFNCKVSERWAEILYSPELRFWAPGLEASLIGRVDALLSNNSGRLRSFARQHSYHYEKP